MTAADLIKWLEKVPPDTVIQVIYHTSGRSYYDQGGNVEIVDFCPGEATPENNWVTHWDYYESSVDGKKTLTLGTTGN